MMKTRLLAVFFTLVAAFCSLASAQTLRIVHAFERDGREPSTPLLRASDGSIYGGAFAAGIIFRYTPDGTYQILAHTGSIKQPVGRFAEGIDLAIYGVVADPNFFTQGLLFRVDQNGNYTIVHSFDRENSPIGTSPRAGLSRGNDGALYGATSQGGAFGFGTIYRLSQDGALTVVKDLMPGEGPIVGNLVQAPDSTWYGVIGNAEAFPGDIFGLPGGVFRLSPDGAFQILHQFADIAAFEAPGGNIALGPDGSLYGCANDWTEGTRGKVYRISPDGQFTVLHQFLVSGLNSPSGDIVITADGSLYGTASMRGDGFDGFSHGGVWKIDPTGNYSEFFSLSEETGSTPKSGLAIGLDGNFYGLASAGGLASSGVLFRLSPSAEFTSLHDFRTGSGVNSQSVPVLAMDGSLYGTTVEGGAFGAGAIYRITPEGQYSILHSFDGIDGATPFTGLVQGRDGALYGVSDDNAARAVIYRVTTSGEFSVIHRFERFFSFPNGHLVEGEDGVFYGCLGYGGALGRGAVYKVTTAGKFSIVHAFSTADGELPQGPLVLKDGNLYGVTLYGGAPSPGPFLGTGSGVFFRVDAAGNYSVLHTFGGAEGSNPGPVVLGQDGSFYTVTSTGAANGLGAFCKIDATGQVTVLRLNTSTEGAGAQLRLGPDGNFYGLNGSGGFYPNGPEIIQLTPDGQRSVIAELPTEDENTIGNLFADGVLPAPDGSFYSVTADGGPKSGGVLLQVRTLQVRTLPARPITAKHAVLRGTVQADVSEPIVVRYEYGATDAYGQATAPQTVPAGVGTVEISASLTRLVPGQTVHYRLKVVSGPGSEAGNEQVFTTLVKDKGAPALSSGE